MPNFDDLLSRELERAARPAAPDPGYVVDQVRRRRARRGVVRRVQAGALTVAVLAATASGFLVLRNQFVPSPERPGDGAPYGASGLIAVCPTDTGTHLCLWPMHDATSVRVLGEAEFLTDDPDEVVRHPAVSPDGTTVVFQRTLGGSRESALWTIRTDGTELARITDPADDLTEANWSPDGASLIAVAGGDPSALAILSPGGIVKERIRVPGLTTLSAPSWAPDWSRIVFSAASATPGASGNTDLYTLDVGRDESLVDLTNTPAISEHAPSWSPDGTSVAYVWSAIDSSVIRVLILGGEDRPFSPGAIDSPETNPAWSPDGKWIGFTRLDGSTPSVYVIRVDGTLEGTLATTATDFAWIPAEISTPSIPSPEPKPEGRDVGLQFKLCHVAWLGDIDFLGDGVAGSAWTGQAVRDDGTCPEYASPFKQLLVVDHTGDRFADSWLELPFDCYNGCAPIDATDLDGNGTEELIVTSYFSIMDYYFFALGPKATGDLQVEPILVSVPGHEPAGISAGEPLLITAGGDAGYSSQISCESYPASPVIVWAWSDAIVESQQPKEIHITRLQLRVDGLFHVIGTNDFTVPWNQPGFEYQPGRACGVDWYF